VFRVSGNARSPKFRWDSEDLQTAVKDRAEEKIKDLVGDKARDLLKEADQRLSEDVKDKARDLLDGVLRPDSSDTTGKQQKIEDLKKEGEKLLKDLFGKKKPKE
jgi:hypothetical protein